MNKLLLIIIILLLQTINFIYSQDNRGFTDQELKEIRINMILNEGKNKNTLYDIEQMYRVRKFIENPTIVDKKEEQKNPSDYTLLYIFSIPLIILMGWLAVSNISYHYKMTSKEYIDKETQYLSKQIKCSQIKNQEIYHSTQNYLQFLISSIEDYEPADNVNEPLQNVAFRVEIIGKMNRLLYKQVDKDFIDLGVYLKQIIEEARSLAFMRIKKNLFVDIDLPQIEIKAEDGFYIALIVNELLVNSCKYAFAKIDKPMINIIIKIMQNNVLNMQFKDNGCGMFSKKGNGSGLGIIKTLLEDKEGDISVSIDNGTKFNLNLRVHLKPNVSVAKPSIHDFFELLKKGDSQAWQKYRIYILNMFDRRGSKLTLKEFQGYLPFTFSGLTNNKKQVE